MRVPSFVAMMGSVMPIRFRCAYCNQLMGIATRKAGTVITCPQCSGQVVVPKPDPDAAHDEPAAKEPHEMLEDEELAHLLEISQEEASDSAHSIPMAAKAQSSLAVKPSKPHERTVRGNDVTLKNDGRRSDTASVLAPATKGFFIPMPVFYLLNLGVVFLLAMTFFAGYWLGRSSTPNVPHAEKDEHK